MTQQHPSLFGDTEDHDPPNGRYRRDRAGRLTHLKCSALDAVLPALGQMSRAVLARGRGPQSIYVVDACAGDGTYEAGGTPIRLMEAYKACASTTHYVGIEQSGQAARRLERRLWDFGSDYPSWEVRHADYREELSHLANELEQERCLVMLVIDEQGGIQPGGVEAANALLDAPYRDLFVHGKATGPKRANGGLKKYSRETLGTSLDRLRSRYKRVLPLPAWGWDTTILVGSGWERVRRFASDKAGFVDWDSPEGRAWMHRLDTTREERGE